MELATSYCTPEEVQRNAECLLDHIEVVQCVLRRRGFSEHANECGVTAAYLAAMPYITGRKMCHIENRRAWVIAVATQAAKRAALRDPRIAIVEPVVLEINGRMGAAGEELFDIGGVLMQLTENQREAVERCWLSGEPQRAAAKAMGIAPSTLADHLKAAKKRLEEIQHLSRVAEKLGFEPSAGAP